MLLAPTKNLKKGKSRLSTWGGLSTFHAKKPMGGTSLSWNRKKIARVEGSERSLGAETSFVSATRGTKTGRVLTETSNLGEQEDTNLFFWL